VCLDFEQWDDQLLMSIAILAENFWYLERVPEFVSKVLVKDRFSAHLARMSIKRGEAPDESPGNLTLLTTLYERTKEELLDLIQHVPRLCSLIQSIEERDPVAFRSIYVPALYPFIVAFVILFEKELDETLIEVMSDVRPLHKLAEVFPPGMRKVEEIAWKSSQNEEEPVVIRDDHLTQTFQNLLSQWVKDNHNVQNNETVDDGDTTVTTPQHNEGQVNEDDVQESTEEG